MKFNRQVEFLNEFFKDWLRSEGFIVIEDYITNHGNICPHCLKKMRTSNGKIKDKFKISFILFEENLAVIYALCRNCFKYEKNNTLNYEEIGNNIHKLLKGCVTVEDLEIENTEEMRLFMKVDEIELTKENIDKLVIDGNDREFLEYASSLGWKWNTIRKSVISENQFFGDFK